MRARPRIGCYYAECCLLDLHKIENESDLADVETRLKETDELGPLMVFPSLDRAIEALSGQLDSETELRELKRLGWV